MTGAPGLLGLEESGVREECANVGNARKVGCAGSVRCLRGTKCAWTREAEEM